MTKHKWMSAVAAAALAAGSLSSPARAQEVSGKDPASAKADDLAAETAYLRAYFAEKELKDAARAEKEYAAVAAMPGASREIAGRALVGRVRALRSLGRADDAATLLTRVTREFANVAVVAAEAKPLAAPAGRGVETVESVFRDRILNLLGASNQSEIAGYGDRAVPVLEGLVREADSPRDVQYAAMALASIDTLAAREARARLLADPALPFPGAAANILVSGSLADIARAVRSLAPPVRRSVYVARLTSDAASPDDTPDAILADTEARPDPDREVARHERGARYLLGALADPALRAKALAVVRTDEFGASAKSARAMRAFFDPPAAVIEDEEARRALAGAVYTKYRSQPGAEPSTALLRALARDARTADIIVGWLPIAKAPAWDREIVLTAIEQPGAWPPTNPQGQVNGLARAADQLQMTTPDDLKRMLAALPKGVMPDYLLMQLASLKTLDDAQVRALLDPEAPAPALQSVMSWMSNNQSPALPPATSVLAAALLVHPNEQVRSGAWNLLAKLRRDGPLSPEVDARNFVSEYATAFGSSSPQDQASRMLPEASRRRLIEDVRPDHPRLRNLLAVIGPIDDATLAQRVEAVLRTTDKPDNAQAAVVWLVTSKRDAADETVRRAMLDDSRPAIAKAALTTVFDPTNNSDLGSLLSTDAYERFLLLAFDRQPGVVNFNSGFVGQRAQSLPLESRRRLGLAALRSKSERDRQWGAQIENNLLDPDAWEPLLSAAEDVDPTVRENSRRALRGIEKNRAEMATFRASAATSAVRGRIPVLLKSEKKEELLAGIAAVVAVHDDGWIAELVRLAAENHWPEVQTAAREALLAIGQTRGAQVPDAKSEK